MASIDLIRASNGSGDAVKATVTNARVISSTTLQVSAITNFPSKFIATVGSVDGTGAFVPASVTVFLGHTSGGNIEIDSFAPGYTDLGNTPGQIVVLKPTTAWANEIADVVGAAHNDNGTLKANSVNTAAITDANVTTAKIADTAVTSSKIDFTTFSGTSTQWRSWTPTLTNFTGTVNVARYTLVGKTCYFYIKITQGASVTGQHTISLPVEVGSNNAQLSPINPLNTKGYILDGGTAQFPAEMQLLNSTTMGLLCFNTVGTYLSPMATSPTVPMTWASGADLFMISGYYETV